MCVLSGDELCPGRLYGTLDSGFNSVDSGDKRWSGNEVRHIHSHQLLSENPGSTRLFLAHSKGFSTIRPRSGDLTSDQEVSSSSVMAINLQQLLSEGQSCFLMVKQITFSYRKNPSWKCVSEGRHVCWDPYGLCRYGSTFSADMRAN